MAEINATILIPDISGFTEFMTTTELSHSSHAIHMLIDAIIEAVGEEYEVSEIEGDAVLLIRREDAPSKKQILDTCLKIFSGFHFMRKYMEQYTICPCGACKAIVNLTLKFVVHHGPLAEIKVGKFVKQSGTDMIIAHRLLKNNIANSEYLLMTEKLLDQVSDNYEPVGFNWEFAEEEYSSIGKVPFQFTILTEHRNDIPDPPPLPAPYKRDDTVYDEFIIEANFLEVYLGMMEIPLRASWVPHLIKVEQDIPDIFIGNVHRLTYDSFTALVAPVLMKSTDDDIIYAESFNIVPDGPELTNEFIFKKIDHKRSLLFARVLNANDQTESKYTDLCRNYLKELASSLKERSEKNI